jgi:hypothetical protein
MDFRIQYFGSHDRLLYVEQVEVAELVHALDRARAVIKESSSVPDTSLTDPPIYGYVILDRRGRLVARGYKRLATPAMKDLA